MRDGSRVGIVLRDRARRSRPLRRHEGSPRGRWSERASWAGFVSAIPAERLRMAIGLGRRRVCAKGVAGNPARAARGIRRVRRYSTTRSEA